MALYHGYITDGKTIDTIAGKKGYDLYSGHGFLWCTLREIRTGDCLYDTCEEAAARSWSGPTAEEALQAMVQEVVRCDCVRRDVVQEGGTVSFIVVDSDTGELTRHDYKMALIPTGGAVIDC